MEQNHLLAIVGPHLVSVATRQVLSPLYSYNLILSSLRLAACSLRLVACSLSPELLTIANGPGKPGPLVLLVCGSRYTCSFLNLNQFNLPVRVFFQPFPSAAVQDPVNSFPYRLIAVTVSVQPLDHIDQRSVLFKNSFICFFHNLSFLNSLYQG